MNSERNPMSSIQCLDANQLIPDDRLSFYGLLARVSDYSQDDPVHSTEGLYRGIDIAHHTFKFPVAALALLYRRRRPAFIAALSSLARAAPWLSTDWPPLSQMKPAPQECPKCPAQIRVLLEMLREVEDEGGERYSWWQASDFRERYFGTTAVSGTVQSSAQASRSRVM
jgi:hypothetical protein